MDVICGESEPIAGFLFPKFSEAKSEATFDIAEPALGSDGCPGSHSVVAVAAAASVVAVAAAASVVAIAVCSSPVPSSSEPSARVGEVKSKCQADSSTRSVVQQGVS